MYKFTLRNVFKMKWMLIFFFTLKFWPYKVLFFIKLKWKFQITQKFAEFFPTYRARNNYWRVTLKYNQNFNTEVTEMCNTAMKWKFCNLSEYVQFQKIKLPKKSTDVFKCDRVDFAHAHPNSNLQIWGCLRPIWPLKSHISSFS